MASRQRVLSDSQPLPLFVFFFSFITGLFVHSYFLFFQTWLIGNTTNGSYIIFRQTKIRKCLKPRNPFHLHKDLKVGPLSIETKGTCNKVVIQT